MNLTILPQNNTYSRFAQSTVNTGLKREISSTSFNSDLQPKNKRNISVAKVIFPVFVAGVAAILAYRKSGLKSKVDEKIQVVSDFIKRNFYSY